MFQDQLSRNSQCALGWYVGWERYVLMTGLLLGITTAAAIQEITLLHDYTHMQAVTDTINTSYDVEACGPLKTIAIWMIVVAGVHLVSMCGLSVLRDRAVSLQDRGTLIAKIVSIILVICGTVTGIVLSALICKELRDYNQNATPQFLLVPSGTVSPGNTFYYCPRYSSFFLTSSMFLVAYVFLSSIFQILGTLWIIYQRAVFLSPPPGVWEDPEEIKALNWICTEHGDVIPTIYMLPPSVHRLHREVQYCMLYSHGNAMDLADTVYTLRALAETFDCAVMGYEYPGYGMCAGSTSEDRCYAAIATAFQCLVDYHKLSPRQIILYGRSLGTGPSTHFASVQGKQLGGLILQSPLKSVIRTVVDINYSLPFDMFCSIDKMRNVEVPVFIMHGRLDVMVPFAHGEALWNTIQPQYRFSPLWLDEASHNDMPRPWVVTEEHSPGESDAEHADKLRRNKESRMFIAKCREYLVAVRANRDALEKEEATARAERKEKRERARQELELKKILEQEALAKAGGHTGAHAAGLPSNIGSFGSTGPLSAGGADGQANGVAVNAAANSAAAAELQSIELELMRAHTSSANGVGGSNKDNDPLAGPITVVGGKQGENQFKHLYNNAPAGSNKGLADALGIDTSSGATGSGSNGTGVGNGTELDNILVVSSPSSATERDRLLHPHHRGPGNAVASSGGVNKQRRQSLLRFKETSLLSPDDHIASVGPGAVGGERINNGNSTVPRGHHGPSTGASTAASASGANANGSSTAGQKHPKEKHHLTVAAPTSGASAINGSTSDTSNVPMGPGISLDEIELSAPRGDVESSFVPEASAGVSLLSGGEGGDLSPDASRRPSITENFLRGERDYTSMVGSITERERDRAYGGLTGDRGGSQVGHSVTYNPLSTQKGALRTDRDHARAERLERERSERIMSANSSSSSHNNADGDLVSGLYHLRERAESRDFYQGADISRVGYLDSRTAGGGGMYNEVSRFGADTQNKLHSVAIRGPMHGHSPQSTSRSISMSTSMQSPSSYYSHIPITSMYANPTSHAGGASSTLAGNNTHVLSSDKSSGIPGAIGANGSSIAGGDSGSGGNSQLPTAKSSPNAQPTSTSAATSGSISPLPLGPGISASTPSTPPLTSKNLSIPNSTGGPATASTHSSSSSNNSSPAHPITALTSATSAQQPAAVSTASGTILAPNPALVPLSMSQLQELMDQLKAKERAERAERAEMRSNSTSVSTRPPTHRDTSGSTNARETSLNRKRTGGGHAYNASISSSSGSFAAAANATRNSPSPTTLQQPPLVSTPPQQYSYLESSQSPIKVEISEVKPSRTNSSSSRASTSSSASKDNKQRPTSIAASSLNTAPANAVGSSPPTSPTAMRVQIHTAGSASGAARAGQLASSAAATSGSASVSSSSSSNPSTPRNPSASSETTTAITSPPSAFTPRTARTELTSEISPPPASNAAVAGAAAAGRVTSPQHHHAHFSAATTSGSNKNVGSSGKNERGSTGDRSDRANGVPQDSSRVSQHRASVSGYDHTSLMSRSRSSRSRWPYSLNEHPEGDEAEYDESSEVGLSAYTAPDVDHSSIQLMEENAAAAAASRKTSAAIAVAAANAVASASSSLNKQSTPPKASTPSIDSITSPPSGAKEKDKPSSQPAPLRASNTNSPAPSTATVNNSNVSILQNEMQRLHAAQNKLQQTLAKSNSPPPVTASLAASSTPPLPIATESQPATTLVAPTAVKGVASAMDITLSPSSSEASESPPGTVATSHSARTGNAIALEHTVHMYSLNATTPTSPAAAHEAAADTAAGLAVHDRAEQREHALLSRPGAEPVVASLLQSVADTQLKNGSVSSPHHQ